MNQITSHSPAAIAASTSNAALRGLGIAAAVLLLAAGGYWWWSSQRASAPIAVTPSATPAAPVSAPTDTQFDPYERARAQIDADQIAQPAGDNAVETYLELLAANPDDRAAREALTELLPFASRVADQAATAGNDVELLRLVGLIERADPGYAQLPALKARAANIEQSRVQQIESELAAQREELAAQAAARAAARASASTPAPAQPQPTTPAPVTTTTTTASAPPASSTAAPAPTRQPSPAQATTAPTTTAPASSTQTSVPPAAIPAPAVATERVEEAEQINSIAPQYPPQALSRRQEGWVDVEMVVDVRGMPRDVSVVGAEPANVFNREALRAAARWRFKPRSIDGTPVESRLKRRINFRLPR